MVSSSSSSRTINSAVAFLLLLNNVAAATSTASAGARPPSSSNLRQYTAAAATSDRKLDEFCPITVIPSCIEDESGDPCNSVSLSRHYSACEARVSEMTLRFNGGGCDQGYNSQSRELFQCHDGSTPPLTNQKSYIVVTDVHSPAVAAHTNSKRLTYFAQYVMIGEDFLLVDKERAGRLLDTDLNVTIYDSNKQDKTLLQTFVFHTSCEHSLFLNDFFGSTQLVGFKNDDQGVVSNFKSATLTFVVTNERDGPTDIANFDLSTEIQSDDLFSDVEGLETLTERGSELKIRKQVYFDVGVDREFHIKARVAAKESDNTNLCEVVEAIHVVLGHPTTKDSTTTTISDQPPPPPTDAPSPAPITAMPIHPNNDEHCNLVSSIVCEVKDAGTDCDNLAAPTQRECVGGNVPAKLTFKYTGQSCAESDHAPDFKHRFVCIDERPGIENAVTVFVSVNDEAPHEVPKNEEFTWASNFGSYIHVTVREKSSVDGKPGGELQNMKIGTRCMAGDDLALAKNYGALQLLGFDNDSQGTVSAYADVELTYMIENKGKADAEEVNAVSKCAAGEIHNLAMGDSIGPGQVKKYTQDERVNLVASDSIRFGLEVTATSNGAACGENNEFFVTVAGS